MAYQNLKLRLLSDNAIFWNTYRDSNGLEITKILLMPCQAFLYFVMPLNPTLTSWSYLRLTWWTLWRQTFVLILVGSNFEDNKMPASQFEIFWEKKLQWNFLRLFIVSVNKNNTIPRTKKWEGRPFETAILFSRNTQFPRP